MAAYTIRTHRPNGDNGCAYIELQTLSGVNVRICADCATVDVAAPGFTISDLTCLIADVVEVTSDSIVLNATSPDSRDAVTEIVDYLFDSGAIVEHMSDVVLSNKSAAPKSNAAQIEAGQACLFGNSPAFGGESKPTGWQKQPKWMRRAAALQPSLI